MYPPASSRIAERRKQLAPDIHDAFQEFSRQVFAAGALDEKTKQLIAVAVAHVTHARTASRAIPRPRSAKAPTSRS